MTNFAAMMQKAQAMKQRMSEMQEGLSELRIEGASGDSVTAVVDGKFALKFLKINPSVVNPEEVDLLEDLVIAAVNDARNKAEQEVAAQTEKIMADMGLPPGMGLPF